MDYRTPLLSLPFLSRSAMSFCCCHHDFWRPSFLATIFRLSSCCQKIHFFGGAPSSQRKGVPNPIQAQFFWAQKFHKFYPNSSSISSQITYLNVHIPGTCLSSILGLEPYKRRPFWTKTRVTWGPGISIYIYNSETWIFSGFFGGEGPSLIWGDQLVGCLHQPHV